MDTDIRNLQRLASTGGRVLHRILPQSEPMAVACGEHIIGNVTLAVTVWEQSRESETMRRAIPCAVCWPDVGPREWLGACWTCDLPLHAGDSGAIVYEFGAGYEPICEGCARRHAWACVEPVGPLRYQAGRGWTSYPRDWTTRPHESARRDA